MSNNLCNEVRLERGRIRRALDGARYGAVMALAYGLTEYLITAIWPLLTDSDTMLPSWHWPMTGLLFGVYVAVGLLLGSAAGLLLPERLVRLSLSVALVFSFLLSGALLSVKWFLLIPVVLLALLATQFPVRLRIQLVELVSPWTISVILLIPVWLHQEFLSTYSLPAAASILGVAVLAVLPVWWWARRRWEFHSAFTARRDAIAVAVLLPLMLLVTWLWRNNGVPKLPERSTPASAAVRGPNVVLVVLDTVRADHLSVYGYSRETTPNLKAFAREATLFKRAIAAGDMSLPSHASLFTGQYASRHGAHHELPSYPMGRALGAEAGTLAEALAKRGYRTFGVSGNYGWLSEAFGLHQGFEVLDHRRMAAEEYPWQHYLRGGVKQILEKFVPTRVLTVRWRSAGEINRSAFSLIEQASRQGPFFLFANYMDAHAPNAPPPPFNSLFGNGGEPDWDNGFPDKTVVFPGNRRMSEPLRQHVLSLYDGTLAYLDSELGRLFNRLRELGLYDNTLIVITSDHGEAFGEKDLFEHWHSTLQKLVHVPLVVKFPKTREARVVENLVSHVDIMPTALDLIGVRAPDVDGISLLRLHEQRDRYVFAESFPYQGLFDFSKRFRRIERAVFHGNLKLIVSTAGTREMYNPWKDPAENRNLYFATDAGAREMEASLSTWLKLVAAPRNRDQQLDEETIERLRSLGYVQ